MSINVKVCLFASIAATSLACKNRDYGDSQVKDLVGPNTAARYAYTTSDYLRLQPALSADFEALNPGYSIKFFGRRDRTTNESREFLMIYHKGSFADQAFALPPVAQVEVKPGGQVYSVAALQRAPHILQNPTDYGSRSYTLLVAEANAWKVAAVGPNDEMSLCREESDEAFILAKDISGGVIDPSKTFKVEKCDLPKIDPRSGAPVKVISFRK